MLRVALFVRYSPCSVLRAMQVCTAAADQQVLRRTHDHMVCRRFVTKKRYALYARSARSCQEQIDCVQVGEAKFLKGGSRHDATLELTLRVLVT